MSARTPIIPAMLAEVKEDPAMYLRAVLGKAPGLRPAGFGPSPFNKLLHRNACHSTMLTESFIADFLRAAEWVAYAPRGRGSLVRKIPASKWKAYAERHRISGGQPICLGAFLAACIVFGQRLVPIEGTPDAWTGFKLRATAYP